MEYHLQETFRHQQALGLFLCEMGSHERDERIDISFKARYNALLPEPTPTANFLPIYFAIRFSNSSTSGPKNNIP